MSTQPRASGGSPGFTLLEVLIAVLIVGIIATAAVPMLGSYTEKAREAREEANMVVKAQAIDRYVADHKVGLGMVYDPSDDTLTPYGIETMEGPTAQLLLSTDVNGNVMGDPVATSPGPFSYGPYLADLPPEPASLLLAMKMSKNGGQPVVPYVLMLRPLWGDIPGRRYNFDYFEHIPSAVIGAGYGPRFPFRIQRDATPAYHGGYRPLSASRQAQLDALDGNDLHFGVKSAQILVEELEDPGRPTLFASPRSPKLLAMLNGQLKGGVALIEAERRNRDEQAFADAASAFARRARDVKRLLPDAPRQISRQVAADGVYAAINKLPSIRKTPVLNVLADPATAQGYNKLIAAWTANVDIPEIAKEDPKRVQVLFEELATKFKAAGITFSSAQQMIATVNHEVDQVQTGASTKIEELADCAVTASQVVGRLVTSVEYEMRSVATGLGTSSWMNNYDVLKARAATGQSLVSAPEDLTKALDLDYVKDFGMTPENHLVDLHKAGQQLKNEWAGINKKIVSQQPVYVFLDHPASYGDAPFPDVFFGIGNHPRKMIFGHSNGYFGLMRVPPHQLLTYFAEVAKGAPKAQ